MRQGGPNTIPYGLFHYATLPEIRGSSEPSALGSMAGEGGRSRRRGIARKQRPSAINTRTAMLSLLAAAPLALAQDCIPLTGSTQCSAFQTASISVNSDLVGFL